MTNEQIKELWILSFKRAICKFRLDENDAKDIAQEVCKKFEENKVAQQINNKSFKSWFKTSTDNLCCDFLNKRKDIISYDDDQEKYDQILNVKKDNIKNNDREFRLEKVLVLKGKDKQITDILIKNNGSIKKSAEEMHLNKNTVKSAKKRIISNINTELNHKNGMLGSAKVLNSHQYQNIKNFVKKFQYCLENSCLEKMRIYFGSRLPASSFDFIKIDEIIDHGISFMKPQNKYKFTISYIEPKGKFCSFIFTCRFAKNNAVSIIDLPRASSKIFEIKDVDIPESVQEQLTKGKKGIIELSVVELDELLKGVKKEVI